ncbi:UDP-N-acetylglucosamine--N-acetylmuramyl-(pentapeptide) pyrophosphoryl-undecaprenol N-acetylglucosamine transferase [Dyadobacter sp. CECT 9623]|uniref:UDP-N-acetylglucosamine--N-acetylmuramyl-(pentapeptide) pyrophosphoryl-undecaprenol N-acetylglucosamine transferase n=1 Tax=Dyadobacter linearis TaxID=2823330 RepID=A0ABM8UXQ5_9BACT|nr:undecaprenyldiphospho-muramoylpentapeptide beta-N-acetylglucosaminyltransferase [Dyadobacter sp. CECT 9623]CAG5074396.1 UDP-N-acetylglucosamine--N-acetylmuramyl-(pentapeptide) pyrophosphoryl-undecaprenol N-acetylglucosamine transferase [Dyadobacter sp. CECT 9623]
MPKKVIISGGGTGGHIYPAIAIADALKQKDPDLEVLFVGALGKMEMEKVPRAGYEIVGLPIAGIKRALSLDNLALPFKMINSLLKAKDIIRDFKPDVAVGVGGFASGPLLMMASYEGIPMLIQEQNSYAGITNKFLGKKAAKICVAYPGMEGFFPKEKIVVLGNPVRSDIVDVSSKRRQGFAHFGLQEDKKTLFVMGGSLGARSINESLHAGLAHFLDQGYQILWQTGRTYIDTAKLAIEGLHTDAIKAFDFIYTMDLAYAIADVVVSRAGALSVSELCLAAKPAILIPFPAASEDHQTKNALALVDQDAAWLVKDAAAKDDLVPKALELLADVAKQENLKTNIRKLAKPTAADDIAEEVLKLIR